MFVPQNGTRYIFVAGKGGVGKTSIACITAVWLARKGYKTLLVTTDPAAHLANVLEQEVSNEPTRIHQISNLWATNIEQRQAHQEYKKRILDAVSEKYDEGTIRIIEEELDSPCSEEMALLDKFINFILEPGGYDVVIFDTAPTGHTLRLLQLPADWNRQMELSGLVSRRAGSVENVKERFKRVLDIMRDGEKTTLVFVLYPEATPILEAWRASEELKTIGFHTSLVFTNLILPEEHCKNEFFKKRKQMQDKYLEEIKDKFKTPTLKLPMMESEIRGIGTLKRVGEALYGGNVD